ncbi:MULTISPECIES: bifunctional phosphoglucose/phosphomannose isomerase [Parageobacillus]|nr:MULTISPECIES: bifunctional phosphoglucose/phosphomannose isomerase [Parageobacillus]BDG47255.1 phosphate starvation-inducible protein PsiE [Parageobacillus sp. KH3-4]
MKHRLDNSALLDVLDPSGMLSTIQRLDEQCTQAVEIGRNATLNFDGSTISNVVFAGVGGSAIGGELLRTYLSSKSTVPLFTCRDYSLPRFVSKETLVCISSNSGNTEEQLAIYDQAKEIGAKIVVVSGGGDLIKKAHEDGQVVLQYEGRTPLAPTARASIGFLFFPILIVLQRLGLISNIDDDIQDAITTLSIMRKKLGKDVPIEQNKAKQLADSLYGHVPLIWGTTGTTEAIAMRWKQQFNENAKSAAFWNSFPELNHNEIVGFEAPVNAVKQMHIVILRSTKDHPQVQKRMTITQDILAGRVQGITEVNPVGNTLLGEIFSLLTLGDHVSVYLACMYGVDPTPIKYIRYLKRKH